METFYSLLTAVTIALVVFGVAWLIGNAVSKAIPSPSLDKVAEKISGNNVVKVRPWLWFWTAFLIYIWIKAITRIYAAAEWTIWLYLDLACVIMLPIWGVIEIKQRLRNKSSIGDIAEATSNAQAAQLDDATLAEIKRLLEQGKRIEAIKLHREATGAGLKDSKEFIESLVMKLTSC